jgi:hypothetical protein
MECSPSVRRCAIYTRKSSDYRSGPLGRIRGFSGLFGDCLVPCPRRASGFRSEINQSHASRFYSCEARSACLCINFHHFVIERCGFL